MTGIALVAIGVTLIVAGMVVLLLKPAASAGRRASGESPSTSPSSSAARTGTDPRAGSARRTTARSAVQREPPVMVTGPAWPMTSGESAPIEPARPPVTSPMASAEPAVPEASTAHATPAPATPARGGIRLRLTVRGPAGGRVVRIVTLRDRHVAGRRAPDEELRFADDACMSARHCELSVEEGAVMLRDLDSSNGTVVNGVPVLAGQRYRLDDGDLIRIGETELMVAFLEGERPSGARPAQRGPASHESR